MRTVGWLILAGLLWLGLVQTSVYFGYPPQLISLARSGYIGTFAIFMMMELRRTRDSAAVGWSRLGLHYSQVGWYLVPLISLFLLERFSTDLKLSLPQIAVMAVFYACQLVVLIIRDALGQMRKAAWDSLSPLFLFLLLVSPYLVPAAAAAAVGFFLWMLMRGGASAKGPADSLIMQIPSLCIAPVVLIALRDEFDLGGQIPRADIETFGMIVNGVGAAIWTAVVMRAADRLREFTVILWIAGLAAAFAIALLSEGILASAIGIVVAELFRGCLWTGTTHLLMKSARWAGFVINAAMTALPMIALLIARGFAGSHHLLLIYATFHALVPLAILLLARQGRGPGLISGGKAPE